MSSLAATVVRRGATVGRTSILKPLLTARLPSRSFSAVASIRVTPSISISGRLATPVAARWKSTDASKSSWGPPIVSYDELKPITEQPSDVSVNHKRAQRVEVADL
jgi:hypothetical protein